MTVRDETFTENNQRYIFIYVEEAKFGELLGPISPVGTKNPRPGFSHTGLDYEETADLAVKFLKNLK